MDTPARPAAARTERVSPGRGRDRRGVLVIALATFGLIVLLWKPWGGADPIRFGRVVLPQASPAVPDTHPAASPSTRGTESEPVPQPTRDPALIGCWNQEAWRMVTLEQVGDRLVRSWWAIEPVAATGPADRRIPTLSVSSARILQLGYCAPAEVSESLPPAARPPMAVWRQRDGRPQRLRVVLAAPFAPTAAAVFRPDPRPSVPGNIAPWPPGRYTIRLPGVAPDRPLWFAVELGPRPVSRSSPAPPLASP